MEAITNSGSMVGPRRPWTRKGNQDRYYHDIEKTRKEAREDKNRRYAENPEKYKAEAKAWRIANPEKFKAAKRRCRLKKKYGLSEAEFDAMFEEQNNRCAVCRGTTPGHKLGWHVDHCHDTGKVRGILCAGCNVGAGHLKHDSNILWSLIQYLEG